MAHLRFVNRTLRLAAMSRLDHHRKQAKLYLRWHREGHYPVAAMIGALLPRFRGMTDGEILQALFKLADAQLLVARKSGHESWEALAQGASDMQTPDHSGSTRILTAEPQIYVTDMPAALDFYVGKLGFATAFTYGEPPFYAQIYRAGARLNLRWVEGPVQTLPEPDPICATLALDEAKPLFLEYEAAGVPFHQKLRTEPWGTRTFIVRDPDGNLLAFAGS